MNTHTSVPVLNPPSSLAPQHAPVEPTRISTEPPRASDVVSTEPLRSPSKTHRSWAMWGSVFLIAVGFLAGRYFLPGEGHSANRIGLAPEDPTATHDGDAIVVTAESIMRRPILRTIHAVGTLNAFEDLVLSSKVEGRVLRVHHDLANEVQPGELLLELDPTDAELAVVQAQRSLQTELAKWGFDDVPVEDEDLTHLPAVVSARTKHELAILRFERMSQLRSGRAISADDFEQARSDAQVQEAEWKNQQLLANAAASTARLRAADLAIAQQRLADCNIRVPEPTLIDGQGVQHYVISERMVSEGTLLRPGTEVFRLVLGKTLKLRLSVPEAYSEAVRVGQLVSVLPSASTEYVTGHVARIGPSVDRATRTFMVEVEVPNDDGRLKPGGFAKANIQIGQSNSATTVSPSSIYSLAGIQKIFVFDKGVVHEHHVELGEQTNDWVEIRSPELPDGAKVITSGQRLLSDGIAVSLRDAPISMDSESTSMSTQSSEGRE